MMITILSVASFAFWLAAGTLSLVNILTTRKLSDAPPPDIDEMPLVSVVIPARNEERAIRRTVESMLAQTWQRLEVIVVDDQSDDETPRIVQGLAKLDERVRLVSGIERPEGWLGKPWALEQGGREAKGEWILFIDADLDYRPTALASLLAEAARHPDHQMHFVLPRMIAEGFWESVMMPGLPCALFMSVPIVLANRGRAVPLALGGGTGNLVRADAWRTIGGHTRLRNAVVDDIGLARMLRIFGFRTRMVRAANHAQIRMYHGLREIIHGFTKNAYSVFAGALWKAILFASFVAAVHLVPWIVGVGGLSGIFGTVATSFALSSLGIIVTTRLVLYRLFGFSPLAAAILHPLEILLFLYIFARSTFVVGIRGNPTWRGRGYPAKITTFGEAPE